MERIFWQFLIETVIIIFLMVAFTKCQPQPESGKREVRYAYSKREREYTQKFLMDINKLNDFDEEISTVVKVMTGINLFLFLGLAIEMGAKKFFDISLFMKIKNFFDLVKMMINIFIEFLRFNITGALG